MQRGRIIKHLTNAAIFIILEVAALNMLRNNSPLQDNWFSNAGQAFMGSIWGVSHDLKDYFSLRETNKALAIENQDLQARLTQMTDLMSEIAHESAISDKAAKGYRYILAPIEKISNNTQHNYIIVGKGSNHGVVKGSGIITGKGAIGVIDAVSENFSYARSFKNHGMTVSARLGKGGTVGPMSWDGIHSNRAILKEIPHHMSFSPGDTVFTSGYSSIFPPDIPLGVTESAKIVNGSSYEIEVILFENYSALRYVIIVEHIGKEEIKSLEGKR